MECPCFKEDHFTFLDPTVDQQPHILSFILDDNSEFGAAVVEDMLGDTASLSVDFKNNAKMKLIISNLICLRKILGQDCILESGS